jgi:probable lipoprotein NlpC
MSHWANRYVGMGQTEIDALAMADGWHCWALAVLVYREQLGITLPTYAGRYTSLEEQAEIASLVDEERDDPVWQVPDVVDAFDLAVFRQGRLETHIGIVVRRGVMLHVTLNDHQPKIEQFDTGRWRHRLTGIYRHSFAAARAAA